MSNFDRMAQMQFGEVARKRQVESKPLQVLVIDPGIEENSAKDRFRRVFRLVDFVHAGHQDVNWNDLGKNAKR